MIRSTCELLRLTITTWSADGAQRLGAALAFYSILSLAPLLLLLTAAGADLFGRAAVEGQIVAQISGLIGAPAAEMVQEILSSAAQKPDASVLATILGSMVLLFAASGMFGMLREALNIIWHVEQPREPWLDFLFGHLFAFLMVMLCGALLFVTLAASAALHIIDAYVGEMIPAAVQALVWLNTLVSFALTTGIFALMFKTIPARKIGWTGIVPGALLTAVLFMIGKNVIGFYLSQSSLASGYGAAGSLVMILVWTYYSAQILFFGAEFTKVYAEGAWRQA
ncbi:MAG: YihY/virulence factor BrkB family protein [Alphaproteobacteria bacterium]